jgi:hypothetical protein
MPRCGRRSGRTLARSRPSKRIVPALGASVPEIVRKIVVLPAPFGPTMATNWPSATAMETPFRTGTAV